ncbi:MAG: NUDIX hydrolase [Acidimicrobiia bacterium]|nr:NUDIX hydrolase [Acidimicrobiia bacterium]
MADADRQSVRAAGGIVTRVGPEGRNVLVVHRPQYDDWSLPKGKVDPGETDAIAAVREVAEETEVRARIAARVGCTGYQDLRGRDKTVQYFAMTVEHDPGERAPDDEVDIVAWWPYDEAAERLTYPHDRRLLVDAALDSVEVLVVRHADAGVRGTDFDEVRELSTRGQEQANALVAKLDPYAVGAIISSGATRCRQTVVPYAHTTGQEIVVDARLAEGAGPAGLIELLEHAVTPVVLCSHGDVIGEALHTLDRRGVFLDGDGLAKAGIWSFTVEHGAICHGQYLAPL